MKADIITKDYISDTEVFADVFNCNIGAMVFIGTMFLGWVAYNKMMI